MPQIAQIFPTRRQQFLENSIDWNLICYCMFLLRCWPRKGSNGIVSIFVIRPRKAIVSRAKDLKIDGKSRFILTDQ